MALKLTGVNAVDAAPAEARIFSLTDDDHLGAALALLHGGATDEPLDRDPERAAERILADPPDLILLDVGPQHPERLELLCKLKSAVETHLVPVIAFGPSGARTARLAALAAGADRWLPSPPPIDELLACAGALLRTRALVRLVEQNQDQLRLRRDWVRYLVHDLRGPLTVAIGNIEFVGDALALALPERRDLGDALADAACALQRMTRMTQDLLDSDRLRNGTLCPHLEPVDIAGLTQEAAHQVRSHTPDARSRPILVRMRRHMQVRADRALLSRVIGNLLINALRYGPAHRPILVDVAAEHDLARVSVANSGPPIPVEHRTRIFEPFVRLEEGRPADGAGLGLPFCRLAVERQGGRIGVDHVDGHVVFHVELPLAS